MRVAQINIQETTKQDALMSPPRSNKQPTKVILAGILTIARVNQIDAECQSKRADVAYQTKAFNQIDFEKAQNELQSATRNFRHKQKETALSQESLDCEVEDSLAQRAPLEIEIQGLDNAESVSELQKRRRDYYI